MYQEQFQNYESASDEVHDLRLELLSREEELLLAKDELAYQESVLVLKAEGKNAEERKANFTIMAQDDEEYQGALLNLRARSHAVALAEAELDRGIARQRGLGWLFRAVGQINSPSSE